MSDGLILRTEGLGKMYRIFSSRKDNLVDALGLQRFLPRLSVRYREFWALRGIDLALKQGSRIGIVGRNGAGKSTLLKLITGNLAATEGVLDVREPIHALIEAGSGFHPEFTGVENVRASLTYQGLTAAEIEDALVEIADFTELGQFLEQPYRTFSTGMQARLAFAAATAILRPKILIIDEILGAGDAYFVSKCAERMRALVDSGATVILVSHSLDHITSMCEEAIWLDRGRVVQRGPALEVVKAYQQFMRSLDDRRLKSKNRKVKSPGYHPLLYDSFSDTLVVQLRLHGPVGTACDVTEIGLGRGGEVEDKVLVGHAQDADPTQACFILADADQWGSPQWVDGTHFRCITVLPNYPSVVGTAAFNLYALHEDTDYWLDITYRCPPAGRVAAEVYRNGVIHGRFALDGGGDGRGWVRCHLDIPRFVAAPPAQRSAVSVAVELEAQPAPEASERPKRRTSRWKGEGTLLIESVRVEGADGEEQAIFQTGGLMNLRIRFRAVEAGVFDVIPTAVLYRLDGVLVCRHIGNLQPVTLAAGELHETTLRIAPLQLGNGYYVFTVALYRTLDLSGTGESRFYDLLDRSYEFAMEGTPPLLDGVFRADGRWTFARVEEAPGSPATRAAE